MSEKFLLYKLYFITKISNLYFKNKLNSQTISFTIIKKLSIRKQSHISFTTIKKLSAQKYNIRLENVRKVREFTNCLKCLQIVNLVNLLFEM